MTSATERLDDVLHAIADPTRRAIIARLRLGEARVTAIAEPIPMSLNSVSKHIRTLERAGLVTRRTNGREHLLTLQPEPLRDVAAWVEATTALWASGLVAMDAVLAETHDDSKERS